MDAGLRLRRHRRKYRFVWQRPWGQKHVRLQAVDGKVEPLDLGLGHDSRRPCQLDHQLSVAQFTHRSQLPKRADQLPSYDQCALSARLLGVVEGGRQWPAPAGEYQSNNGLKLQRAARKWNFGHSARCGAEAMAHESD